MNSLLIVTCSRDAWGFEMLCRSIQKFLKPANIYIVINEQPEHVELWKFFYKHAIQKLLAEHTVKLFTREELYGFKTGWGHTDGWVHQQILKIFVSEHINDNEYLIVDSKNFFLEPTTVENIKQTKPTTGWMLPDVEEFAKDVCNAFHYKYPGHKHLPVTQNITPFVVNTESCKQFTNTFGSKQEFYNWFMSLSYADKNNPAEFVAYEIFCYSYNLETCNRLTDQNSATIWRHIVEELKTPNRIAHFIKQQQKDYNIKVSGFHGGLQGYLKHEHLKQILNLLNISDIWPIYNNCSL